MSRECYVTKSLGKVASAMVTNGAWFDLHMQQIVKDSDSRFHQFLVLLYSLEYVKKA